MTTHRFGHLPRPYTLVAPPPVITHVKVDEVLKYFRVNMAVVIEFVVSAWPLFISGTDDIIYEYVTETVTGDGGLFSTREDWSTTSEYFAMLEQLVELIFQIREDLKRYLLNVVDLTNEADTTQLHCRAAWGNGIAIQVIPAFDRSEVTV